LSLTLPLRPTLSDALSVLRSLLQTRKGALSDWYLALIESETERWLATHFGADQFDIDALPHDYVSEPPRNRPAAERSLASIRRVLSVAHPAARLALAAQLVAPLRTVVYDALKQFCADVRRAFRRVATACGVVLVLEESSADLPLDRVLAAMPHDADAALLLRACVSDLSYFDDMLLLEDQVWRELTGQTALPCKAQRKDIVPVTSLVFTKLRGLESMFATALDHHSRSMRR
jgi:hypothetical protein